MLELVSEDRQRKSTVLQIIRKSVPSGTQVPSSRPLNPIKLAYSPSPASRAVDIWKTFIQLRWPFRLERSS